MLVTTSAKPPHVADRLHSAAIHLLRSLRDVDRAAQISPARLSALSVIVFAGPVTLGDLARAEQVRPPTVSKLVADLAAEGLITRKRDVDDRRVIWLRPTAKGSRLLQKARDARVDALAGRVAALTAGERKILAQAAEIIDDLARG
jgi:DNA-binding MarR family transcriptional regulator